MSENQFIHNVPFGSGFTFVSNSILEHNQLSWIAKSVLCFILSRLPNWKVHTWQLAQIYQGKQRGNGMESIKGVMKELREAGYINYVKSRGLDGKWIHTYHVYPLPYNDFKKMFPEVVQPALVEPASVKPPIITNTEITNTEVTTTPTSSWEVEEVSSKEIENHAKRMKSHVDKFIKIDGDKWNIPLNVYHALIDENGIDYVTDQLNCMLDQQKNAKLDEENAYKKKKTEPVAKPKSYLTKSCRENWALSTRKKTK